MAQAQSNHPIDKIGLSSDDSPRSGFSDDFMLLFLGAAAQALIVLVVWLVYTVVVLAWRPLLCLAGAWLVVGFIAATDELLAGVEGPWWQPYNRVRNEVYRRTMCIRQETGYQITEQQAATLAWCEFKADWWQEVRDTPLDLILIVIMILIVIIIDRDA